jgi:hypothetical protein
MEKVTRLQGIFAYFLIDFFISKTLRKSVPPCSPKGEPLWKQTPIPEPYLIYLSGSPVKEPSLQVLLMEPLRREMPCF